MKDRERTSDSKKAAALILVSPLAWDVELDGGNSTQRELAAPFFSKKAERQTERGRDTESGTGDTTISCVATASARWPRKFRYAHCFSPLCASGSRCVFGVVWSSEFDSPLKAWTLDALGADAVVRVYSTTAAAPPSPQITTCSLHRTVMAIV